MCILKASRTLFVGRQKLYMALDEPDGVTGITAIKQTQPTLTEQIVAFESIGKACLLIVLQACLLIVLQACLLIVLQACLLIVLQVFYSLCSRCFTHCAPGVLLIVLQVFYNTRTTHIYLHLYYARFFISTRWRFGHYNLGVCKGVLNLNSA